MSAPPAGAKNPSRFDGSDSTCMNCNRHSQQNFRQRLLLALYTTLYADIDCSSCCKMLISAFLKRCQEALCAADLQDPLEYQPAIAACSPWTLNQCLPCLKSHLSAHLWLLPSPCLEAESPAWVVAHEGFPHAHHHLPKHLPKRASHRIGCVQHEGILCRHHLSPTQALNTGRHTAMILFWSTCIPRKTVK